jgi:hypothetical protein
VEQLAALVQLARQRRSLAQMSSGPQGTLALHWTSAGNWHTPEPPAITQLCPAGQSFVARQASWHLPMVQTSGELQSLLSVHSLPTSIFLALLQATASPKRTVKELNAKRVEANIAETSYSVPDAARSSTANTTPLLGRHFSLLVRNCATREIKEELALQASRAIVYGQWGLFADYHVVYKGAKACANPAGRSGVRGMVYYPEDPNSPWLPTSWRGILRLLWLHQGSLHFVDH